jgi:hypothetical protein
MMKQFRQDGDRICTDDPEAKDEIRRDIDSCSCARAGWAYARAPFAAIVAAGSVVVATIACRVIKMTRGHNRKSG